MTFVNDERLQAVITDQYWDSEMRRVSGIYKTCDDDFCLISSCTLDSLMHEGSYSGCMSLEEAEEQYGDEIVRRYFEKQKQLGQDRRMENLFRGIEIHKEAAQNRRAQIIAMVINGYSKQETEEYLNICRSTVDNALKGISAEYVRDLYNFKQSVFKNVSGERLEKFIEAGCSYRQYRKLLQSQTFADECKGQEEVVEIPDGAIKNEVLPSDADEQGERISVEGDEKNHGIKQPVGGTLVPVVRHGRKPRLKAVFANNNKEEQLPEKIAETRQISVQPDIGPGEMPRIVPKERESFVERFVRVRREEYLAQRHSPTPYVIDDPRDFWK